MRLKWHPHQSAGLGNSIWRLCTVQTICTPSQSYRQIPREYRVLHLGLASLQELLSGFILTAFSKTNSILTTFHKKWIYMDICRNCFRKRGTMYSDIFYVLGRQFWQLLSGVVLERSRRQIFCVLNGYIKKLTWRRMSSTKSIYLKHTTHEWISLHLPPPIHWHTTEAYGGSCSVA